MHVQPPDCPAIQKKTAKDPVLSNVIRFTREGWPKELSKDDPAQDFRRVADSLSIAHNCLLYGPRIVIPTNIRPQILSLLHEGHFGIQRMKQLARTAVYRPKIDDGITDLCRRCVTCAAHQNKPIQAPAHPWLMPEKPWSRLHIDHAINFLSSNWLVTINAYSKYPCIHSTQSVSSKSTIELLDEDF